MLALADLYMGRDARGHYNNSTDVRVAVNCVDKPHITDRAKVVEEDRRTREVAPFMSYGEFTGLAPLDTCAFWPVPATGDQHEIKVNGPAADPGGVDDAMTRPRRIRPGSIWPSNSVAPCSPSTAPSTPLSSRGIPA